MAASIRSAAPSDSAAMMVVCLKTGDSGADGTAFYKDDPDALGVCVCVCVSVWVCVSVCGNASLRRVVCACVCSL